MNLCPNLAPVHKAALLWLGLAIFLGLGCSEQPPSELPGILSEPPPIVLISIDTLRRDHLGLYGHFQEGTTNLDSFAMVYNAEVNLWVNDHRFAQELTRRVFVQDIPNAKRVKVRKLRFWEKIRGRVMYSMRKFL